MKKKIIVCIICLVIIAGLGTYIIINHFNDSKKIEEKIRFSGKEYNNLEEITIEDLEQYLEPFLVLFERETYETFTDEDIALVVAYNFSKDKHQFSNGVSTEEVKDYVKRVFGINDFQLKEGLYEVNSSAVIDFNVSKNDNKFICSVNIDSSLELENFSPVIIKHDSYSSLKDNQIIVENLYGIQFNDPPGASELYGINRIYLKYVDNNLIIEKIVFENPEKDDMFREELEGLAEIDEVYIQNYTHYMAEFFTEKTYETFGNDEIFIITVFELLGRTNENYTRETATDEEIKIFVKNVFGIENYEFKPGEYDSPYYSYEKIIVEKQNDKYISNMDMYSLGDCVDCKQNFYKSMEIKDNQVVVHYEYGKYDYTEEGEIYNTLGYTDIYLEYVNNNLRLEKIIYTEKK